MKIKTAEEIKSAARLEATPHETETADRGRVNSDADGKQAHAPNYRKDSATSEYLAGNGEHEHEETEDKGPQPLAYAGPPWPSPMGADALHGLTGDIVRRIEPHTESDPAAILVQFLIAFGNVAGRGAHWIAESTPHFTNEFAVIVGESSIARKGTSLDRVLSLFLQADKYWTDHRTASGLVSGEGLIFHIRDPRFDPEGQVEDPGIKDKRLFVCESEFAQVLSSGARKDNTLSVVIRNAWDGKKLRSLAKNSGKGGDIATDPHVSIVGHIVHEELKAKLANHDAVNGVVNRFLWACSRRSKHLPFGGNLKAEDCEDLTAKIHTAIAWAKDRGEIGFSEQASELWADCYPGLNQPVPGVFGSAVSRAPAHVRRVAVIYALLDCADKVDVCHLKAALAVWRYCYASAEFLFGGLSQKARDVFERLRSAYPAEMSKTDLFKEFRNNISAGELAKSLDELRKAGMAASRREQNHGAPSELWRACEPSPTSNGAKL